MKPITLGCERGDQIQKYGSYDACMKEREKEKAIQDMLARRNDYPIIGGSDTEKKVFEMQRAERQLQDEEAKKVRKKYIIYGLIVVAGYFAYKKFKK